MEPIEETKSEFRWYREITAEGIKPARLQQKCIVWGGYISPAHEQMAGFSADKKWGRQEREEWKDVPEVTE